MSSQPDYTNIQLWSELCDDPECKDPFHPTVHDLLARIAKASAAYKAQTASKFNEIISQEWNQS